MGDIWSQGFSEEKRRPCDWGSRNQSDAWMYICVHTHTQNTRRKKLTWRKMEDGLTSKGGAKSHWKPRTQQLPPWLEPRADVLFLACRVVRMRDVYTNLIAVCCRNHGEANLKDLLDLTSNWPVTLHRALLSKPADTLARVSSPGTGDAKAGRYRESEISQCYKIPGQSADGTPTPGKNFFSFYHLCSGAHIQGSP